MLHDSVCNVNTFNVFIRLCRVQTGRAFFVDITARAGTLTARVRRGQFNTDYAGCEVKQGGLYSRGRRAARSGEMVGGNVLCEFALGPQLGRQRAVWSQEPSECGRHAG